MIFISIPEFDKDIKRLLKKYKSIEEDLESIKSIVESLPNARPPFSYMIDNLGLKVPIIKIKKIASKSFPGKGVYSGLRLIYIYFSYHFLIMLQLILIPLHYQLYLTHLNFFYKI